MVTEFIAGEDFINKMEKEFLEKIKEIVQKEIMKKEKGKLLSFADDKNLTSLISSLINLTVENYFLKEEIKNIRIVEEDTGLYTEKHFLNILNQEIKRAKRYKYPLSLAILDFVSLENDLPKEVLYPRISKLIKRYIRSSDYAGIYHGRIALIFPYADEVKSVNIAQRLRKYISLYPLKKEEKKYKLYIGISSYPLNASTSDELLEKAEESIREAIQKEDYIRCSLTVSYNAIKVGFCPPALTSPFYTYVILGMNEVIRETGGVDLEIQAPKTETDIKTYLEIINYFIEKKMDCLAICCPILNEEIIQMVKKANQEKIEVYFFNTPFRIIPPYRARVNSYIGYNQKEAGRKIADYLVQILRGKGNILIIEGIPEEITSQQRKEGFLEVINSFAGIKIVGCISGNWEREKSEEICTQILTSYKEIDAIFAVSDEMAIGAADAVEKIGLTGKTFILGLDGTPNALNYIRQKKILATLNTNPLEMGKVLIRTILRKETKGEKIHSEVWIPTTIVDLQNIDFFSSYLSLKS